MIRKTKLLLLIGLLSKLANAESILVHSASQQGKITTVLPFVESKPQIISERINSRLIGSSKPSLSADGKYSLPDLSPDDGDETRTGYTVVRNDGQVLTITFENQYCGAYCEEGETYENFDANNGRFIYLTAIFTKHGLDAIADRLAKTRLRKIQQEISLQKRAIKANSTRSLSLDERKTIVDMYEECGKYHSTSRANLGLGHYMQYGKMMIGESTVTFTHGRCSPHVIRALDDLGEFKDTLPITSLAPFMTRYGKALLIEKAKTKSSDIAPFFQLLHGKMGNKTPISIYLEINHISTNQSDLGVSGYYLYKKYKKPISLSGNLNGDKLTLTEDGSTEEKKPRFTLQVIGDKLLGEWEGNQKLKFEAAP